MNSFAVDRLIPLSSSVSPHLNSLQLRITYGTWTRRGLTGCERLWSSSEKYVLTSSVSYASSLPLSSHPLPAYLFHILLFSHPSSRFSVILSPSSLLRSSVFHLHPPFVHMSFVFLLTFLSMSGSQQGFRRYVSSKVKASWRYYSQSCETMSFLYTRRYALHQSAYNMYVFTVCFNCATTL